MSQYDALHCVLIWAQVEMDDTERAMLAEANAAANGGPPLPPPPHQAAPDQADANASTGDAAMDIEVEPEPANIRIVRDYKRQDPRCVWVPE